MRYAIADIRGELTLLEKLIEKIGPSESDSLIFLGSYLGPGPDSKGIMDYLLKLREKLPNCSFLRGCYEWVFGFCVQDICSWEYAQMWGTMKGQKVFNSYADDSRLMVMAATGTEGKARPIRAKVQLRIPESHIRFMAEGMHQWYEDDLYPYVLTHSGGHPALFGGKLESEEQT